MKDDVCACGLPLHYTNPKLREMVEALIARMGPNQIVSVDGVGSWEVPRHYIALHGVKSTMLPALARHLGFKKVEETHATSPNGIPTLH